MKYIVQAFKEKNIKQKDVIKDLNVPQSYASALMNGKKEIGKSMAEKLSSLYGFDKSLLLINEDLSSNVSNTDRKIIQQPTDGYIPVYDVTFTLGFTPTFLHSQNEPEILGYVNFPELRGSTYVVKAKGNSMAPIINDRDFVGIRPVKNKRIIDYGNPYGIITEDLAVFKKIKKFKDDENRILLTSENPEHESFDIEKKDVLQLFSVIGVLSVKSITY